MSTTFLSTMISGTGNNLLRSWKERGYDCLEEQAKNSKSTIQEERRRDQGRSKKCCTCAGGDCNANRQLVHLPHVQKSVGISVERAAIKVAEERRYFDCAVGSIGEVMKDGIKSLNYVKY